MLLVAFIFGVTLLAPLFVLGMTGGNWRMALIAWKQYSAWLFVLALPGLLTAGFT